MTWTGEIQREWERRVRELTPIKFLGLIGMTAGLDSSQVTVGGVTVTMADDMSLEDMVWKLRESGIDLDLLWEEAKRDASIDA